MGYIRINFSYDYPVHGTRSSPRLMLRNRNQKQKETAVSLSSDDNGKIIGPFPCGDYKARLYAEGVKPQRKWVPVSIAPETTNTISFKFTPDGTISGFITNTMRPENWTPGMPAWETWPGENRIPIQSITLKGTGINRSLKLTLDDSCMLSYCCFPFCSIMIGPVLRYHRLFTSGKTGDAFLLGVKPVGTAPPPLLIWMATVLRKSLHRPIPSLPWMARPARSYGTQSQGTTEANRTPKMSDAHGLELLLRMWT